MSEMKDAFFAQAESGFSALSAEDREFQNSFRHWDDGRQKLSVRYQKEQYTIDPLTRLKALIAGERLLGWIRDVKEAHDLATREALPAKVDQEVFEVAICLPRSGYADNLQSFRAYCQARGYRLLTLHEGIDVLEEVRRSKINMNDALFPLIIGGNTEVVIPKEQFFDDESHTGTILFNGFMSENQPAATFSLLPDDFPFAAMDGPQPCFLITSLNKK